ncbi:NAD-dependent epimerase/dehydratase family protein [Anaerocolumna sp.]|uniref:NAD-dependent epimerase/dehydratase family protein n=1 Tax=Anaerocolumna sp. TaxID=2041569 RepID=UPI0028A88DDA|nr:NAD(P)-dependent oxidoreductase [Anaerocolumna sp.]
MNRFESLKESMYIPSEELINDIEKIDGDIMILGVSGKMGVNLAKLAKRASNKAKNQKKIYGVARFTESDGIQEELESEGIETIKCDFMSEDQLEALPEVKNIIYMVGYKFGTVGNEDFAWAINSYLPGRIANKYKASNIVAFSTGCVYPLVKVSAGAPSEEFPPEAVGEYAQSCLGRERILQYFSKQNQTPMTIFRLNYAIDLKYGVLSEIAQAVLNEQPIDLTMGHANVIWQKDACEMAVRSLRVVSTPANVINVTGPETVSIRWMAERFAEKFNKTPKFTGIESDMALLSNASKAHTIFGYPKTTIREMIDTTSEWLLNGGDTIDKPTHFQEREGKY